MLAVFGGRLGMRATKGKISAAWMQLKQSIFAEPFNLNKIDGDLQSDERSFSEEKSAFKTFLEASVSAWIMKSLISKIRMI